MNKITKSIARLILLGSSVLALLISAQAFAQAAFPAPNPKVLMIKPGPLQASVKSYPTYVSGGTEASDRTFINDDILAGSLYDAEPTVNNAQNTLQLANTLTFRSIGRVRTNADVNKAIAYLDALINDYYNQGYRSVALPAHSALIAPWVGSGQNSVQKRNPQWFGSDPIKFAIFNAGTTAANAFAPKFVDFVTGSSGPVILQTNVKSFLNGQSPSTGNLFFLSDTTTASAATTAAFISVIGSGNMKQFSLPNVPPFDPCFGGAVAAIKAAVAANAPQPVLMAYSMLGDNIDAFIASANQGCSTAGNTSLFGAGEVIYAYAGLSGTGSGNSGVTLQLGLGVATLPSGEEAKYYVAPTDPLVLGAVPALDSFTNFENNLVVSTGFLDLYKYLASPVQLVTVDNKYREVQYANGALFTGMVEHDLRFDTNNQLIQRSLSFSSVTGTNIKVTSFLVNGRWYDQNASAVITP